MGLVGVCGEDLAGALFLCAPDEDDLVAARGATDHGDVRAGDPEQPRQESLELAVGLAIYRRRPNLQLEGILAVGTLDGGVACAG